MTPNPIKILQPIERTAIEAAIEMLDNGRDSPINTVRILRELLERTKCPTTNSNQQQL